MERHILTRLLTPTIACKVHRGFDDRGPFYHKPCAAELGDQHCMVRLAFALRSAIKPKLNFF